MTGWSLTDLPNRTLGDLVAERPAAAGVFEHFGLDYCCRGQQTLADAVERRELPLASVTGALAALEDLAPAHDDPARLPLDGLTRYIVERHHQYIRQITPTVEAWLNKLVQRHGDRHPELAEARKTFQALSDELALHMMKEENILFPFIEDLAMADRASGRLPAGPFGTVLNPIRAMESEHEDAGQALESLRQVTNGYTPPDDGCTTYRLCYEELARYEQDLHQHIHLENNVLHPRAVDLERRLT